MTVNKTQFQARNRLAKEIQTLKHQQRALKNPQPLGADVINVMNFAGVGQAYTGSVTLAAGQQATFTITFRPNNAVLSLWNFTTSLYVDADATAANLFGGFNNTLTSAQKNCLFMSWTSLEESNDTNNYRAFRAVVRNNDSGSHTYYFYVTAYLPALAGSTEATA